ncbi:hypothetical protein [Paenibacillus lentus]|uniref:Uncharacterized protein n=1 Tax=Paenibacillus lentus TaxID=1338368 RepID=A0A3Q8S897_9BACL|nr:hypothetical protein [Paenibacillus lentus]AZK44779.1 hypothetical protein EIM92_00025 [Paenibacillus lentus]
MLEDVKKRLESFGYAVTDSDTWVLDFIIQKTESHIKNQCNTPTVPEGLHHIAVDMAVGEFLLGKKSIGQLTGFDLEAAVKSIQEGDTNITFALGEGSKTPEARLDLLINFLLHPETNYAAFRCIKW